MVLEELLVETKNDFNQNQLKKPQLVEAFFC
jgi:hypothetical protein